MKYCPYCGNRNDDLAYFCAYCGVGLNESADLPNEMAYNPNVQPFPIQKKSKKPMIIATIAIVASLILAGMLYVFVFQNEQDELGKLLEEYNVKVEGAPTTSMQSLAGGNFRSIPQLDHKAKYYLYYNGDKIGEIEETAVGTETYNGVSCYKIVGRSDVELRYSGQDIAFEMDHNYYVNKNGLIPVYMSIDYDFSKPSQLKNADMSIEITWDLDSSEIISTVNALGKTETATAIYPEEYWGMISSFDDLFVGLYESFEYSISTTSEYYDTDMIMEVSVTGKEDVVVPAGTFEDCYVLELDQTEDSYYSSGNLDSSMKVWISEEGYIPQYEASMGSGLGLTIFAKLEGYYTK